MLKSSLSSQRFPLQYFFVIQCPPSDGQHHSTHLPWAQVILDLSHPMTDQQKRRSSTIKKKNWPFLSFSTNHFSMHLCIRTWNHFTFIFCFYNILTIYVYLSIISTSLYQWDTGEVTKGPYRCILGSFCCMFEETDPKF